MNPPPNRHGCTSGVISHRGRRWSQAPSNVPWQDKSDASEQIDARLARDAITEHQTKLLRSWAEDDSIPPEAFSAVSNKLKNSALALLLGSSVAGCNGDAQNEASLPEIVELAGVAQNPEGIEYDEESGTFLLSSLNATPIIKVHPDGTYEPFTQGEQFPLSTAGLEIDHERSRLLAASYKDSELWDDNPETKGAAYLRVYSLNTGMLEQEVNLSVLAPEASSYFANDIAVDDKGNAYISDWHARVIYKVDPDGNASLFWTNETGIPSGPNGLDFHPDGYLLVSVLNVDEQSLYADYGLIKVPLSAPETATAVAISGSGYAGFDGMVINDDGNAVGVTNNGIVPGGNVLLELSGRNNWESAEIVNTTAITASTTVAVTPGGEYYVINQDFSNPSQQNWTIEQVKF